MHKACIKCQQEIFDGSRFCGQCGSIQTYSAFPDAGTSWGTLKQAALFYAIEVIACCLFNFVKAFQNIWGLSTFELITVATTGYFVSANWSLVREKLICQSFSWKRLLLYSTLTVCLSVIVSYSSIWLNDAFFSKDVSYYWFFSAKPHGLLLLIFFMAVMPALFEELAYRGYLLSALLTVVDKQQAILITSFLFALVHFSFISLYWLVPLSLLAGYLCVKERTLWYGVVCHFLFNLTACAIDVYDHHY